MYHLLPYLISSPTHCTISCLVITAYQMKHSRLFMHHWTRLLFMLTWVSSWFHLSMQHWTLFKSCGLWWEKIECTDDVRKRTLVSPFDDCNFYANILSQCTNLDPVFIIWSLMKGNRMCRCTCFLLWQLRFFNTNISYPSVQTRVKSYSLWWKYIKCEDNAKQTNKQNALSVHCCTPSPPTPLILSLLSCLQIFMQTYHFPRIQCCTLFKSWSLW